MKKIKVCIIGLGYVGLPLAIEFSKYFKTIGFDIDSNRVSQLNNYIDTTNEVEEIDLRNNIHKDLDSIKDKDLGLIVTDNDSLLSNANFYIITVPTPVDENNNPNFDPLIKASSLVANFINKNDIVVFESTVYPGATEDICVKEIEKKSNLKLNEDFYVGYSPERINPGDKDRTVEKIIKVTSGSNKMSAKKIDDVYKTVIKAGTFLASSIRVAEAAKVIENCQRDINIAFVNELSKIFNLLNIDTNSVLEAAGTKWNFMKFKPGLVGGHCIGVDPYYLAKRAIQVGYNPEVILSGRRINDEMGDYVANQIIKFALLRKINLVSAKILILGITFKENCPDIRNTKVIDIIKSFNKVNLFPDVYDPEANKTEVLDIYGVKLLDEINNKYDIIIHAVSHQKFNNINLKKYLNQESFIYDVKSTLPLEMVDFRL